MRSVVCLLVETVGFELLRPALALDLKAALREAMAGGVVFVDGSSTIGIFRRALSESIRDIESTARGRLLRRFLSKGPYEDAGQIPARLARERLTDAEVGGATSFIYSHMVNCFKGGLAELLAVRPVLRLMRRLQQDGALSRSARLFVGDTVRVRRAGGGYSKGADMHILVSSEPPRSITVVGVVEVKSYARPGRLARVQLDNHTHRARLGLRIEDATQRGRSVPGSLVRAGRALRVSVLPSTWLLPRTFRFERTKNGRRLHVAEPRPPSATDEIRHVGPDEWRVTLRWSREALAEAAYEMTFWYMEKLGEAIYSASVPREWAPMTSSQAGRNAAKQMLYYSILRARNAREEQRAVALYNTYGFGYALGMNHRGPSGRREMLWPKDLDEIAASERTAVVVPKKSSHRGGRPPDSCR